MQRLRRITQRGSRNRTSLVDETSTRWKERAGRETGPNTYVPGDLCDAVFKQCIISTHKERDDIYGGPAILVGILECCNVKNVGPKGFMPNLYCTVVPLGIDGKEIDKEKRLTRTITGNSAFWDEMYAFGTSIDTSQVSAIRIKLKHFESKWKSEKLGEVDIFLDEGLQLMADANLGHFHDVWLDINLDKTQHDSSAFARPRKRSSSIPISTASGSSGDLRKLSGSDAEAMSPSRTRDASLTDDTFQAALTGQSPRIHVRLAVHRPPPDPTPIAIHVNVVEAKSVLASDSTGFSDPYVRIRPKVRMNENCVDLHGKTAEHTTAYLPQTLDPVWNESVLFVNDGDALEPIQLALRCGIPEIGTTKHITAMVMSHTRFLEFTLYDRDVVGRHDGLGDVTIALSDLFGDEDAVIGHKTLHIRKWYRIRPSKGMDQSLEGLLGHLRLHITLIFSQPLLPAGWMEAVDTETNETYFYNTSTRTAQWHEPVELTTLHTEKDTTSAAAAGSSRSTEERYRRGSVDALMFLALRSEQSASLTEAVGLSAIDEIAEDLLDETAERSPLVTAAEPPSAVAEVASLQLPPLAATQTKDDEDADDEVYDKAAMEAALARMDPFKSGKKPEFAEFSSPLSVDAAGGDPSTRMKALSEALKKEREDKRKADEAALAAKLAAMTPEEKAAFEQSKMRDARIEQRKNRMLHTQMDQYGKAAAAPRGVRRSMKPKP